MIKRVLKEVSILLVVLMLGVFAVGCGGSQNTGSSEQASAGNSNVSSEQGAASSAENAGSSEQVTVRYARWGLPEEMNGTNKIIAAFEDENPNIKVELESCDWDTYWEKIQTEIASDTAPDVMLMDGGWYLTQFAPGGLLEDIGALMEQSNIPQDDYYNVWKTFTYDGKIYSMPRDYNSIVLYYNKDLFAKAGITEYPDRDMTWQDLIPTAQKLTLDNNGKNALDPAFDPENIVQYGLVIPFGNVDQAIETLIWQNGGQLMSDDGTKCLIDTPEAEGTLQFLHDLAFKYHVSPSNTELTKYNEEEFPTGNFAMVYQGSWLASSLADSTFSWDIAVAPTLGKKIYCAQSVGNSILTSTKHNDEAWKLVQFMSGKEGQTIMAQSNDSIPVLKDVAENFYDKQGGNPANKQAIFDEAVNTVPYVSYPGKSDIFDAIAQISGLYFDDSESLDKTVSDIMAKVESIQSLNQ